MAQSTQIRPRHERGHSDEMGLSAHRGRSTWRPSAPGVAWPAGVEHRPSAVAEPVGGDCADMAADHNLPRWRRRATAVAPLPSHKANPASERSKPASKRTPPGNEASEGWNPTAGQGLWFPPVLSQAVSRVGVPIALRQVILAVIRRVGWICVSVAPPVAGQGIPATCRAGQSGVDRGCGTRYQADEVLIAIVPARRR